MYLQDPPSDEEHPPLLERYKLIVFSLISLALIAGVAALLWQRPKPVAITIVPPEPTAIPSATLIPTSTTTPGPYTVYVSGAVATPEIVITLDYGSRVWHALAAVGGPLANADLERVNLAQRLQDGDQVHVPTLDAALGPAVTVDVWIITPTPGMITVYVVGEVLQSAVMLALPTGNRVADAIAAAGGTTANADLVQVNLSQLLNDGDYVYVPPLNTAPIQTPTPNHPPLVHINTATVAELEILPGIGPTLAQAIIDYRAQYGPFADLEALDQVPGLGETKLDDIRDWIVFD